MEKLSFYDLKSRKKFLSDSYVIKNKSGRKFAVAKGPSGNDCWRVMGK